MEITADPGEYNFFRIKKENLQDSSSIGFRISSKTVNCYVSKDNSPALPTSANSIKLFPLTSSGDDMVAFKPEEEIPGFDDQNYGYLVLCKFKEFKLLAILNENDSSIKVTVSIIGKESATTQIVRYILYIVFGLVGIVGLLYCVLVIIKSNHHSSNPPV